MKCRYCLKPITNDDNHGWVTEDGLRRCLYNNEVMLKEHIPMPKMRWVGLSAEEIYTKQPLYER